MAEKTSLSSSIRVEHATLEDRDDLVDFQIRMAMETEELHLERPVVTKGVEHILENPVLGHYIVAKEDTEVIGCALITYEWSDWRNGLVWWLQSVYVIPEVRQKGVFRLLWGFVQQRAKIDEKIKGIRLYVDATNSMAKNVYHRIGMQTGHYELFEWMKDSSAS